MRVIGVPVSVINKAMPCSSPYGLSQLQTNEQLSQSIIFAFLQTGFI